MFFGTHRPHKGIEELIHAVSLLQDRDIMLTLVGVDEDNHSKDLVKTGKKMLGDKFKVFGLQPFEKVPEFLTMADMVVIPQKKGLGATGQVPAKVFDAMAMAKPIIATDVSDLPEILDGCGWIVEPGNSKQLAETIQYVLNNPEEAEKMGRKARQKCIEKYSWDAMEKILVSIFSKYE
jgi:glycosyltransferase involved in cell wall biosynthesis